MQIHICSASKRRFTGITPHTGVSPSPQNQSQTHTRKCNQPPADPPRQTLDIHTYVSKHSSIHLPHKQATLSTLNLLKSAHVRVSLCVSTLFSFVRSLRDRRLRSVPWPRGGSSDGRPEGTYSILHKWHHTVTALRHPPELIQQRITTSQIRWTASSSYPEHTELCQHERRSGVSVSELEGSFVRLAASRSQAKSPINVSKHSLCQHH